MTISFTELAWKEYLEWQKSDKKIAGKINELIKDIQRNGFIWGIGKPEVLKYRKEYSRRINDSHRLTYIGDEEQNLIITSCKDHYDD